MSDGQDTRIRPPRSPSTEWPISPLFVALVAAFLGSYLLMVAAPMPELARVAVFPLIVAGWLISLCLHEFGHAIAAYHGGDYSVRDKGYLTLDPLRYTDVQFSILWPLVFLAIGGIGLPGGAVYINRLALRTPQWRSLMSAAGPLATLVVLITALVILQAAEASGRDGVLLATLAFLAFLQLTALVLNLLPVPGLDGWGIIEPWLPNEWQEFGWRAAPIAPAILFFALLFIPGVSAAFWRFVYELCSTIGLDANLARQGLRLFQFWR
jgi:Zn-dependent protease